MSKSTDESTFTFPYRYKKIEFGKVLNPFVSINVKSSLGWQPLWFLVDSGADVTTLTLSTAENLKLAYNIRIKERLYGIGEQSVFAYPGEVYLKLGHSEARVRCYFINAPESTLLLGRLDIFDKFNILFDSKNEKIEFRPL